MSMSLKECFKLSLKLIVTISKGNKYKINKLAKFVCKINKHEIRRNISLDIIYPKINFYHLQK